VGYRYFTEAKLSKGVLLLNEAIGKHGVPEMIYTDNGSQFASRSERLNNFELFCAAYNVPITHTVAGRPQGKGKIERFFETVENQFIAWVRAKIKEDAGKKKYTLTKLNIDLDSYLQFDYHQRVHSITNEMPITRFRKTPMRAPDPPVDVTRFLDRTATRTINKFGELSFNGYKIQVNLPHRSKVLVIETIETIRVEQGELLIREVNKNDLSKELPIKRQDGAGKSKTPESKKPWEFADQDKAPNTEPSQQPLPRPDENENIHKRKVGKSACFEWMGYSYYAGVAYVGEHVFIQLVANSMIIRDKKGNIIKTVQAKHEMESITGGSKRRRKMIVYGPDVNGFHHRKASCTGTFRWLGSQYFIGRYNKNMKILVRAEDNKLRVYDEEGDVIATLDINEEGKK
jgi:hypothetical protein